jgi:hypothetical protein
MQMQSFFPYGYRKLAEDNIGEGQRISNEDEKATTRGFPHSQVCFIKVQQASSKQNWQHVCLCAITRCWDIGTFRCRLPPPSHAMP